MINTEKLELRVIELKNRELGNKPFNKWSETTNYELSLRNLDMINNFNEEIKNHGGELVIDDYQIVRLKDVIDGGDDYYWVYNKWVGLLGLEEKNEGVYEATCVGSHTRLKGFIPDKEYNELVRVWNLNNYVKAK